MNEAVKQVRVGVTAFIIRPEDGHIMFTHRIGRHGVNTWAPAGGHQEYGESPLQTCVREYEEEVGLLFDETDFTPLGFTNDFFEESGKHYITLYYAAVLPTGQVPRIMEPETFSGIEWFPSHDLPSPLFQPCVVFFQEQWAMLDNFISTVRQSYAA